MKKTKVGMLALAVLAGGSLVASAATTETFRTYWWDAFFPDSTKIWDVSGGPSSIATTAPFITSYLDARTDGAGKIMGSGWLGVTYNSNGVPFSWFVVDMNGKLKSSKPGETSVSATLKGTGYTADGTGSGNDNKVNLKFTGEPRTNPLNTNSLTLLGVLSGNIQGKTPLGEKNAKISDVAALIDDSDWFQVEFEVDVLQSQKKLSFWDSEFTGNGTIKDTSFKATGKGIGSSKGSTLSMEGTLGLYTNTIGSGTNAVVVPFLAPKSATITKGRLQGQAVTGSSSFPTNMSAGLIY